MILNTTDAGSEKNEEVISGTITPRILGTADTRQYEADSAGNSSHLAISIFRLVSTWSFRILQYSGDGRNKTPSF
jgi:hypothetical protein